jgi:hypothetical protein
MLRFQRLVLVSDNLQKNKLFAIFNKKIHLFFGLLMLVQQNIFLLSLTASKGMTTLAILAFRYQMVETVSASIAILLGILLIYLVLYYSPKEMGPFKYLVVNTTVRFCLLF